MEKEAQEEKGRLKNKKPSPEYQQCAVQKKKKKKKKTHKIGENGNSNVPSLGLRAGSGTAWLKGYLNVKP